MERGDPRRSAGPGPVAAAHRILIATALAAAIFFAGWQLREWRRTGQPFAVVVAVLAIGVAGALAVYLRSLRGLGARLSPRDDGASKR